MLSDKRQEDRKPLRKDNLLSLIHPAPSTVILIPHIYLLHGDIFLGLRMFL